METKNIPYGNKNHKTLAKEISINFSNKINKQEKIESIVTCNNLHSHLPSLSSFQELTQDQVKN